MKATLQRGPRVIAFTGYARSGKNTAAQAIEGIEVAFADRLKSMLSVGLDFTHEQLYGNEKHVPIDWLDGVTPRRAMEALGTEWGRQLIHPEIWVRATRQEILKQLQSAHEYPHVIVTDVRMENEAEMIRELGGVILHIRRGPRENLLQRIKRRFGPKSERGIAVHEDDEVIYNDGSVLDLHLSVVEALSSYYEGYH